MRLGHGLWREKHAGLSLAGPTLEVAALYTTRAA